MKTLILLSFFVLFTNFSNAQNKKLDKEQIPHPVFEQNPGLIDLYWKAWEIAWQHVKKQSGIVQSPYMDEAFDDNVIWIWDTEFMVLYCKYAPLLFPGIESLRNFYEPLLDKSHTSLSIQHPDNPPFFAWVESEYFNFTNDIEHLENLIIQNQFLQRHFEWFDTLYPGKQLDFKHAHIAIEKKELGYKWGGVQSGMDNTPRGREQRPEILWIDALSQQALASLYISRLAEKINDTLTTETYKAKYNQLKELANAYYWDEKDGFYYDILENDTSFVKVKTPASYWAMLAEIPNQEQAKRLASYASDPNTFGGKFPWPTVERNDEDFNAEYGDYWRGAIWLPTAYMATKALEKYGFYEIADKNAYNLLIHMLNTYNSYKPATIWECYNPTKPEPSKRVGISKDGNAHLETVRPDFCGWSALGPISLFIENVLGFHSINAQTKTIEWKNSLEKGKHGIKNLQFGNITTDIVGTGNIIKVNSNAEYTLVVNGTEHNIQKGNQTIILE